jgi:hypothetical protein
MDLTAVCNHCGRPMCAEHAVVAEVGQVSTGFADLDLEDLRAWYCAEHDNTVSGGLRWLVVTGFVAVAVGLICLLSKTYWVGGSFVVAGGTASVLGYVISRRRRESAVHERPPFPLAPTIKSVRLSESIHAVIRFDHNGDYQVTPQPATGRLTLDMVLRNADRNRLGRYRHKYDLDPDDPVPYSAGFVVLRGPVGLTFDDQRFLAPVFALRGMVSELPFLVSEGRRSLRRYPIDLTHRLRTGLEVESIPLWLTPSLVPESDRRALNLDIQWDPEFGHEDRVLEIDHISDIRVLAPVGWGAVQDIALDDGAQASRRSFAKTADPDDPDESVYLIKMSGIRLPRAAKDKCRLTLRIQFEGKIETADSIRGSLDMRFRHALSGVSEVEVYHALGSARHWKRNGAGEDDRTAEITTTVTADFWLSLAKVRYQDTLVVPDPRLPQCNPEHAPEELPHVVPDHRTVAALTDALSGSDYYVKRVVENPGSNGPGVDETRRYWDITGRHYWRLFPIEFRITLTGNEDGVNGNTMVAVAVRGVYTDPDTNTGTTDPAMKSIIEQTWQNLRDQTVTTLRSLT